MALTEWLRPSVVIHRQADADELTGRARLAAYLYKRELVHAPLSRLYLLRTGG